MDGWLEEIVFQPERTPWDDYVCEEGFALLVSDAINNGGAPVAFGNAIEE